MKKPIKLLQDNFLLLLLIAFNLGVLLVSLRINLFRYNNFDFGKFDLGNMTQMVWYTLNGKLLYLTDYFGSNVPRWSMSHVDPILLLFVPIFFIIPHALTLVFSQIILILASSIIVYLIANLILKSKLSAFFFGVAFTFYPAVGFLIAWTGFHGVSAAIPFFLLAFYTYEKMFTSRNFSKKLQTFFWICLIITMSGKEQLPLYVVLYGLFICIFRFTSPIDYPTKATLVGWIKKLWLYSNVRTGTTMIVIGILWFITAFFIIIPKYAHYRIDSFNRFAVSLDIDTDVARDVESPNYFLSRYAAFGDSYLEVAFGMATHPAELARVIFGGDKPENLTQTLAPLAYTPILYPTVFMIALPDFLINYATTQEGIGVSEIINHRVSMIIPVLFIAAIFSVRLLATYLDSFSKLTIKQNRLTKAHIAIALSFVIMFFNIKTSFDYNNPIYMWLVQAVQKRIPVKVEAKVDGEINLRDDIQLGEVFRLSPLDNKDRECADKIVRLIPNDVTVSGPDYLGAHLALRETYAIFPALYKEADYVVVDVFSQKILRILDLDVSLVKDVVADIIGSEDYQLKLGCGNLFVFEKVGPHNKSDVLPLQERFVYEEKTNLEIFQSLTIVDYHIPDMLTRGNMSEVKFTYVKREETRLDDYVLFLSFINSSTGEIHQMANLPSFSLNQLRNWNEDRYYLETIALVMPEFLDEGEYKVFIGMTNSIRTRSIYLGDITLK